MITTTWELHFTAPRSLDLRKGMLSDLETLKEQFTILRLDYLEDGETISVMVADIEVLRSVMELEHGTLEKLTCQFTEATYDGTAHGTLVLDDEEDERSEISFPTKDGSE